MFSGFMQAKFITEVTQHECCTTARVRGIFSQGMLYRVKRTHTRPPRLLMTELPRATFKMLKATQKMLLNRP